MPEMVRVFVGIGSNLGDRAEYLRQAVKGLRALPQTDGVRVSSVWETPPWGTESQEPYYNAVAEMETMLSPLELLTALQQIETALGRVRPYRWAPRTVDLDLLMYGNEWISEPALTVPHPLLEQRLFVLAPLYELAASLILPDGKALESVFLALKEKEGMEGFRRIGGEEFFTKTRENK